MTEIALIKDRLISELWVPTAMGGGSVFYPRLRKNKNMKLLTLTNPSNFREVTEFISNNLTKKDFITGWNYKNASRWSLEAEGKMNIVLGSTRYEDSMLSGTHDIQEKFPFNIVNLDFSSQNPEPENGRLEREIFSIEHTIKLQVDKGNNEMVLIYTTLLDSNPLNIDEIKRNSDNIIIQGWNGLSINRLPSDTTAHQEKITCLKEILRQIYSKYRYRILKGSGSLCIELPNGSGHILSVALLIRR